MTASRKKIPATLIPGDGIGPEIVAEAVKVLAYLRDASRLDSQPIELANLSARENLTRMLRHRGDYTPGLNET